MRRSLLNPLVMSAELKVIVTEVEAMIFYNLRSIATFMDLPIDQRISRRDWLKKTVARTELMISAVAMVNQP